MKNFKKVVAAGLALLMLALSVNVTFAAEEYTDKEAVVVAKVNAAGIMTGTEKGFEPSKTLTRAEAAAIFVRMKGISEATVKQNAGTTLFTDVAASHWAAGYINVASNYGIIKGVGANKFAPEKEVTVAEFYTMAIRALNAGQLVEAEGTWPTNYVNFAIENKLAEDVAQVYSVTATRMTAATIVANTLVAPMWAKTNFKSNGEITWGKTSEFIAYNILNIVEIPNVEISEVNAKDLEAKFKSTSKVTYPHATYEWTTAKLKDVVERANISSAKAGMKYTIWYDYKEDEVLGFWVPDDSETLKFDDVKTHNVTLTAGNSIKLTIDGKDEKFDTTTSLKLFVNGADKSLVVPNKPYALSGVAYYGLGNDSDKIDQIYLEDFENYGLVKEVTSNKIKFEDLENDNASTITVDTSKDAKNVYNVTKDGKQIDVTDIEAGDVLFYYITTSAGIKTYTIKVSTDTVEGKVKTVSDNKVTIDGKEYKDLSKAIKAGDEITAYLNEEGKILFYEKAEGSKGDFGVVSAIRWSADKYDATEISYEVKMTNLDTLEMSDWMEIDLDETKDEMGLANKAAAKTWVQTNIVEDGVDTYADAPGYGKVFAYIVEDGKAVFTKQTEKVDAVDKDLVDRGTTVFADNTNSDKLTSGANVFYTVSGTKAFELDVNDKTTFAKKEVKVKAIELADVDSMPTVTAGDIQLAGIDYKNGNNTVDYVIFASAKLQANQNWAFVLSAKGYADDDNKDAKHIYSVVYADGTTETLYDETSTAKCVAGSLYELTVKDDVITNAKTTAADTHVATFNTDDTLVDVQVGAGVYLTKEFSSRNTVAFAKYATQNAVTGVQYKFNNSSNETEVILDENLIVIRLDEDGKYHVADFDDVVALEANDLPYLGTADSAEKALNDKAVLDGYTEIQKIYSFTDVDGSSATTTAVAIVFAETGFIPAHS